MIRPLLPSDKSRVLAISQQIWEGEDYILTVFDTWITQENGEFTGFFVDDQLIGFSKLTMLTPEDAWLEGMRKDQSTTIKGVAQALTSYHLRKLAALPGLRSVRFSTHITNYASIASAKKHGFTPVFIASLKHKDVMKPLTKPDGIISSVSLESLAEFVESSSYLRKMQGFFGQGWVVPPYHRRLLVKAIAAGDVAVLQDANGIQAAVTFCTSHGSQDERWISFIEAHTAEDYQKLLAYAHYSTALLGQHTLSVLQVDDAILSQALADDDYKSWEEPNDFLVYELPLARLQQHFGGEAL